MHRIFPLTELDGSYLVEKAKGSNVALTYDLEDSGLSFSFSSFCCCLDNLHFEASWPYFLQLGHWIVSSPVAGHGSLMCGNFFFSG